MTVTIWQRANLLFVWRNKDPQNHSTFVLILEICNNNSRKVKEGKSKQGIEHIVTRFINREVHQTSNRSCWAIELGGRILMELDIEICRATWTKN